MSIHTNINGAIKTLSKLYQNVGGAIKEFTSFKVNVNGAMKELMPEDLSDCIVFRKAINSQGSSSVSDPVTTPHLIPGFSYIFEIGITAISGGASISTQQAATIKVAGTLKISDTNSKIKIAVNGTEMSTSTKPLSVGDTVSVSGNVSTSGSGTSSVNASLTVTIE